MVTDDAEVARWRERVRAEYNEMPGLHLTKPQVKRLWGLDAATCEELLEELERERFLRLTESNTYVRVDIGQ